jgi:hypothetical protein
MKLALRLLAILLALPALCVAGFFVASVALTPRFEPVDFADPPRYLAVMGAWDDPSGFACRAFYYEDVERVVDSLPSFRFRVSSEEFGLCVAQFRDFSREGRWPRTFPWERTGHLPRLEAADSANPDILVVKYPPGEDYTADTRYRVDGGTGEPTDFEYRGFFGLAWGMGVVFYGGGGGILVWLALVTWIIASTLRRRREAR